MRDKSIEDNRSSPIFRDVFLSGELLVNSFWWSPSLQAEKSYLRLSQANVQLVDLKPWEETSAQGETNKW